MAAQCTTLSRQKKKVFYLFVLAVVFYPLFLQADTLFLDVDGSGVVDANDGVLIVRRLNGGSTINTGIVLPKGKTNSSVVTAIDQAGMFFDVDGNGRVDATDGVLIVRRLNGGSTIDTGIVLPSGTTNSDVVAAIVALGSAVQETNLNAQVYYPLNAGTVWTYQDGGQKQSTVSVAQNSEVVNDRETKKVLYAGGTLPDRQEYYSNNGDGLLFHSLIYVNSVGEEKLIIFRSPLVMANATIVLGETISTAGKAFAKKTLPNGDWIAAEVDFQATAEIVRFETVTVPAGQFSAIKIKRVLSLQAPGLNTSATSIFWFSKNVGVVKEISTISGVEVTTELVKVEN